MKILFNFANGGSLDSLSTNQPMAVMSAELAKRLLKRYADSLVDATPEGIIRDHIDVLTSYANDNDLNGAIGASLGWMKERDLIDNVSKGNWNVYAVPEIA